MAKIVRRSNRKPVVQITGLEANFLLFALDDYVGVNLSGKVMIAKKDGLRGFAIQDLRDALMAIHEHPEEDGDGNA